MLSENEGDGELGGSVMELIKLGPLSMLLRAEPETQRDKFKNYHVRKKKEKKRGSDRVGNK